MISKAHCRCRPHMHLCTVLSIARNASVILAEDEASA